MADNDVPERPLTLEDREHLNRLQQRAALKKAATNPLAANIGVINADLSFIVQMVGIRLAHRIRASDDSNELPPGMSRSLEGYLHGVRETERLTALEQRLEEADVTQEDVRLRYRRG